MQVLVRKKKKLKTESESIPNLRMVDDETSQRIAQEVEAAMQRKSTEMAAQKRAEEKRKREKEAEKCCMGGSCCGTTRW